MTFQIRYTHRKLFPWSWSDKNQWVIIWYESGIKKGSHTEESNVQSAHTQQNQKRNIKH